MIHINQVYMFTGLANNKSRKLKGKIKKINYIGDAH